jgi:hypothetical protein
MTTYARMNAHTGITEMLTDIHPMLRNHASVICFAVVDWRETRCEHPAKFLSERGVPVCGHHTKKLQAYTLAEPGEPATNQF